MYNKCVEHNFSTSNVGAMSETHEVTLLLAEWAKGNPDALNELMPLVYRELRQLAASYPAEGTARAHPTANGARP